jgi:hypothetical protein
MSNDDEKKTGKTDFSNFRISANNSGLPVAQKVLMHVPVGKPGKQRYVRVHHDNKYRLECAILKLEDDERPFLISPNIASAVAQDIKLVTLQLSIDRQGNVFLWPVPPVPEDGNDNSWNQSQREIATMAENQWIRLSSNRATGSYEAMVAKGEIPEPPWPDLTFEDILEIAFGKTHIIDNRDHPALRKLWGME